MCKALLKAHLFVFLHSPLCSIHVHIAFDYMTLQQHVATGLFVEPAETAKVAAAMTCIPPHMTVLPLLEHCIQQVWAVLQAPSVLTSPAKDAQRSPHLSGTCTDRKVVICVSTRHSGAFQECHRQFLSSQLLQTAWFLCHLDEQQLRQET